IIVNSFKPYGDIIKDAAALPAKLDFQNYAKAWNLVSFPKVFLNSVIVNSLSIAGMVLMGSMTAWRLVRRPHLASKVIFILFVSAMMIPFQSVMIPMVKMANLLGLVNSLMGVVIVYFGFGVPLTVFLFHGYIKSIPRELEDAAYIDGCGTVQTFFLIVLPLLKPMVVTVIIVQLLWVWNDFLLPALLLFSSSVQTIPLGIFAFFGQHMNRWDWALSTLIMGMVPVVVFFLSLQKYVIRGITAGSVKA
ncbi:MAG: carbohydrate ABC transporter permease, partial [Spirochaetales bacterium]|nr:carbohydrate ABC transporter permease [Spirochaetales bacterium]